MTTQQQQRLIDALEALGEAVDEIADTIRDATPAEDQPVDKPFGDYVLPHAAFRSKDAPDCEGTWLAQTESGEWDPIIVIRQGGDDDVFSVYAPGSQRPERAARWRRFVGPLPDPRPA